MLSSSMPVNQARRSQSWHEMKTTGVVSVSTISTRVSSPQPQSGHTCGLSDSPKPTLAIEPSGAGGGTGRRRRAVPRFAAPFVVPLLPSALVRWCGICLSDITTPVRNDLRGSVEIAAQDAKVAATAGLDHLLVHRGGLAGPSSFTHSVSQREEIVRTRARIDELGSQPDHLPPCLLYTSDAADDLLCVDLGGRRIIKKKK